jgi:hypothetical protein
MVMKIGILLQVNTAQDMSVVQRDRAGKRSKQNTKDNKDRNVSTVEKITDDL